jgi:hypothetical protein
MFRSIVHSFVPSGKLVFVMREIAARALPTRHDSGPKSQAVDSSWTIGPDELPIFWPQIDFG